MSHQVSLTVCGRVEPDRLADLRRVLSHMDAEGGHNPVIPFADLPGTHFARLLIVDDAGGSTLMLMLECDAPARRRLKDLVAVAGPGLDTLFMHCSDYLPEGARTSAGRLRYVRTHLQGSDMFYVHSVGRTVRQIHGEARLREAVECFLDRSASGFEGRSALQVRAAIQAFVRDDPELVWALSPPQPPNVFFRTWEKAHKIALPAALVFASPVLLPALLFWVAALRLHELRDPAPDVHLDPERMRVLGDAEDFGVQNAFTSLAPIKPGRFWELSARMSLWVANYSSRHIFNSGSLAGLRTVHFAHFMRIGPHSHVLFTSYYDGSLEGYNNDFVDQVAWVLNTVFGYQEGYPRTRWLGLAGARNENGFKAFIRGHQIPTQVWYSAYPQLAAVTIDTNARVRSGLRGEMSAEEADEWLQLL